MKKNTAINKTIDYLIEKYCVIYTDKNLVERFNLSIPPEELLEEVNKFRTPTKSKVGTKKSVKTKEIREAIKLIDDEEKLFDYYKAELINYFDKSKEEREIQEIINKHSKEELSYLYGIISNVPLQKSKKKEDILWLMKSYFDNRSRVDAMKL